MDSSPHGSSVHGTFQARILGGGGCHFFLQGIFLDQGLNLCLLRWQVDSLSLSHQGSPLHAWPCNKPFCASKKEGRKKESKGEGERAREVGRDEKRKKETKKNICLKKWLKKKKRKSTKWTGSHVASPDSVPTETLLSRFPQKDVPSR